MLSLNQIRTLVPFAAFVFAGAFLQLVTGLWGLYAALFHGAALGVLFSVFFRFFEMSPPELWVRLVVPAAASLAGVAILLAAGRSGWQYALAPAFAACTSAVLFVTERTDSRRCGLCNQRIGAGLVFVCPRCDLLVCEQRCWIFEHCRCRLCERNRVPVLSIDASWWDRHLGARMTFGNCQLCLTAASEADLRACGRCGRPQCRECWDDSNGQCMRCSWIVDDLPQQLKPYVTVV